MRHPIIAIMFILAAGASAHAADKITLTTGESIIGTVVERNESTMKVSHPILGQLTIPINSVASVESAVSPATEATRPPVPPTVATVSEPMPEPVAAPEEPKKKTWFRRFSDEWENSLEIGANVTTGNSEATSLYVSFKSSRETERFRTKWDLGYRRSSKDSDMNEHEFTAGITNDFLRKNSKWFSFVTGRYEYDEFQSWSQRITTAAGLGHHTYKDDQFAWTNRAGIGSIIEFDSEEDDIRPEGFLGTEIDWKITDSQTLAASSVYHPDLSNPMEFRLVNKAEWIIKINKMDGVSLKVGMEHEYDSEVDSGTKHNDFKAYSTIIFDF